MLFVFFNGFVNSPYGTLISFRTSEKRRKGLFRTLYV